MRAVPALAPGAINLSLCPANNPKSGSPRLARAELNAAASLRTAVDHRADKIAFRFSAYSLSVINPCFSRSLSSRRRRAVDPSAAGVLSA